MKTERLYKKKNGICWVPKCKKPGQVCTITADECSEAEVVLCEKHFAEARAVGQ